MSLVRPGISRVLAALDQGGIEGLVILKLDCLTRSVRELVYLLETYFTKNALLVASDTHGGRPHPLLSGRSVAHPGAERRVEEPQVYVKITECDRS